MVRERNIIKTIFVYGAAFVIGYSFTQWAWGGESSDSQLKEIQHHTHCAAVLWTNSKYLNGAGDFIHSRSDKYHAMEHLNIAWDLTNNYDGLDYQGMFTHYKDMTDLFELNNSLPLDVPVQCQY